ncbi:xanthine dehydrogenase 1-like isoform X2 [Xenia sp. Carnegie-2017]|uniref:xanthine dehydrogenase 1-like isoform X2 n=1 Tax=Xenia sp. Carnegie-2017 TaxID=2897299 RepID=UPI001F045AF0|nr:xanthine dehydrogenase 1-like isoform X2 [Xenia sp. Carnegie-2017]
MDFILNRNFEDSIVVNQVFTMEGPVSEVYVEVNGVGYKITNTSTKISLNEWLRAQPGLKGTKVTCQQGGCGSCVVALTKQDPVTGKHKTIAVNSCLIPLYGVDGLKVKTIEGIGSRVGYHPIQDRIIHSNGSQCGFCTPGMVMNMYSLLCENPLPTKQEIEDSFDGNICRCTGYRPILDAMKSFAQDENPIDIEDLTKCKGTKCQEKFKSCFSCFDVTSTASPLWYKPLSLTDLYNILKVHSSDSVRYIVGNTGKGVYKDDDNDIDVYINIADIPDLNIIKESQSSLLLGAALSLSTVINELIVRSSKSKSFDVLTSHIKKVASVPVRNVGSFGGNLMLLYEHREFPSDIFTIMAAVNVSLTIGSVDGSINSYSLEEFLLLDMKNKVLISVEVPYSIKNEVVSTFKIMPRHQNAHAYVNAGFRAVVGSCLTIQDTPSLIFGGIKLSPLRARETEKYLSGKNLLDASTFKDALAILKKEISPDSFPTFTSVKYRKTVALGLFYKFYLLLLGDKASARVKSASLPYIRPISSGKQSYDTDASRYPLTKPMTKITAKYQASGEAQYTDDIPKQDGEVYAAFVTTTVANCKIGNIDTSKAMAIPGVLKFISAEDIPGVNNFIASASSYEQVFCDEEVGYAGQAVGVIVAETQSIADKAAEKVEITYTECKKPIITIEDAINAKSFFTDETVNYTYGDTDSAMKSADHVVNGEISMGTQHHFHMETHISLCIPGEEEMEVFAATQWIENTQAAIAQVLNLPQKSIHVSCKRCGGSFGSKALREAMNSTACALAAYVMNRPVRLRMNLRTNMTMVGKRFPYIAKYKVGVSKEGILKAVELSVYSGCGLATTETLLPYMSTFVDNAYFCENWKFFGVHCKTNTATSAATRSPGTIPSIFIIETVMNHVAKVLGKSPDVIREINFYKQGQTTFYKQPLPYCSISKIWQDLKISAEFEKRKATIADFNKSNRWRKRGISMVPLRYGVEWSGSQYTAYVAIFRKDGTVSISHGGVEMGQGINTKVCQVAAYTLGFGLTVDQISVRPATSFMNPNGSATWASIGSELCCKAVINCCTALKERISRVAKDMKPGTSWKEIIAKCYDSKVDLSEKYKLFEETSHPFKYNSYGSTCTEAEIDVLTGETEIIRSDILFDCGSSMNPEIDVGQVEGAFIMGLGYWLTEKAIFDETVGLQLNTGTWDYHPPSSKDIPVDFRVSLLKDAPNPLGVLRSKAVGEPPQCMSCSTLFAVQDAIYNAREEIGKSKDYFALNGPATVDEIQLNCLVDPSQFVL